MSSERPEFRPIEAAPARHIWIYAVMGAVIAGLLIFIARRNVAAAAPAKEVALATAAPSTDPKPSVAPAAETLAAAKKAQEGPNVLGSAVAAAGKLAMEIAAYQKARQPPPPSDQEQILQMLAPVLRSSNDGRP